MSKNFDVSHSFVFATLRESGATIAPSKIQITRTLLYVIATYIVFPLAKFLLKSNLRSFIIFSGLLADTQTY